MRKIVLLSTLLFCGILTAQDSGLFDEPFEYLISGNYSIPDDNVKAPGYGVGVHLPIEISSSLDLVTGVEFYRSSKVEAPYSYSPKFGIHGTRQFVKSCFAFPLVLRARFLKDRFFVEGGSGVEVLSHQIQWISGEKNYGNLGEFDFPASLGIGYRSKFIGTWDCIVGLDYKCRIKSFFDDNSGVMSQYVRLRFAVTSGGGNSKNNT